MFNNIPPNGFPQIPDIEDLEAVVKDVKTLKTTAAVHGVAIMGLEDNKDDTTNIAPSFSAESNYSVGDLVYYEGTLYECTTEHEAAEWNADDFTAVTIAEELSGLKSGLTNVEGWNNLIAFGQTDKASTLSFSGTAYGRSWICEIVVVGQIGITSPINVSTGGAAGVPANLSETYLRVSENSYGISGSESANGTIHIGSDIYGNWGAIYVRSIHDHLKNANISIAYDS